MTQIDDNAAAISFKALRINAGHTQKETAHMLSVSVRTVKRWESGECPFSPAYIELYGLKLAQAGKPVSTMSLQN